MKTLPVNNKVGKVVAEPCTIQTIKVPNHNRVPTRWLRWLTKLIWAPGGEGWDPRSTPRTVARLACPLGNAKDALGTIA